MVNKESGGANPESNPERPATNQPSGKGTRPKRTAFWASPAGEAEKARQRAERVGRANPKNLGRTGPNRAKPGRAVPDWQIARALTSGQSALDVAAEFKMELRTVSDRAESLHLAEGTVFLCDQGRPFREKDVTQIWTAAGFPSMASFVEYAELKKLWATRNPEAIRIPEIARPVIAWRDRVILAMSRAEGDKERRYHNHEVIHTFLPELAELRDALAETFGQSVGRYAKPAGIRAALIEHPDWKIEDVWNFTAQNGRRNGKGSSWHRTMCFLWEIEAFLGRNLERLRNTDSIIGFVFETLGQRYGVHPARIKRAMQKGKNSTRTIPSPEMLGLVQLALRSVPPQKPGPGPELGFRKDTRERIRLAGALLKVYGKTIVWKDHAKRLFPVTPGTAESNTYNFISEHRARIVLAAQNLTLAKAKALVR